MACALDKGVCARLQHTYVFLRRVRVEPSAKPAQRVPNVAASTLPAQRIEEHCSMSMTRKSLHRWGMRTVARLSTQTHRLNPPNSFLGRVETLFRTPPHTLPAYPLTFACTVAKRAP